MPTSSSVLPPLPIEHWLPDESLFSICSRSHLLLCNSAPSITCERLFGSQRQGIQHDFPCNLTAFEARTYGSLGTAVQIAQRNTILPFFAPFQSRARMQAATSIMLGPRLGTLKYQMGLLTGRFGAAHPLKACPQCIVEDKAVHGVAYWHLSHQYPGCLVCTRHKALLWECALKRMWAGRFSWCLPDFDYLVQPTHDLGSSLDTAVRLAITCAESASLGFSKWFDRTRLRQVYVGEILGEDGIPRKISPVPMGMVDALSSFTAGLSLFRPLQALPSSRQESLAYIQRLLQNPRAFGHPLRHLVAIIWLFESFEAFLKAYDLVDRREEEAAASSLAPKSVPSFTTPIVTQRMGQPRPKTLKPLVRKEALRLLANGVDKHELSQKIGISICTINKLLRAEPDTKQAWENAVTQQECQHRRAQWCACAKTHSSDSLQQLRQQIPEVYAWLYRNDRSWLLEHMLSLPNGRRGNHSCVDWNARDQQLAQRVKELTAASFGECPTMRLKRKDVYAQIPELPSALRRPDRYSVTRALLSDLLHSIDGGSETTPQHL